jgi:hypothetical protein
MNLFQLLSAARVNRILGGIIQDPRQLPAPLVWNQRIPDVPAADDEIMARMDGQVMIADLVADDAKAVIYQTGRVAYETNSPPNLKVGVGMNQSMLNALNRLNTQGGGNADDQGLFDNWQVRTLIACRLGVAQRMEQLKIAMLCDGLGFTYDRLGIKLTGISWGMYSDLKITVGTGWDTAATATPVTDILRAVKIARVRYGITYNRVTMSTSAFEYMIATTEFQNKSRQWLAPNVSFVNLNRDSLTDMAQLARRTLGGIEIELYDQRFLTKDLTGVDTFVPYLPIGNVILTDSQQDGNGNVWDFANGIVTESIVASMAPVNIIGRLEAQRGPLAYVAAADGTLNPPGLVHWGVGRGFPRRHYRQASAVLNVGSFSDTISTALPALG